MGYVAAECCAVAASRRHLDAVEVAGGVFDDHALHFLPFNRRGIARSASSIASDSLGTEDLITSPLGKFSESNFNRLY